MGQNSTREGKILTPNKKQVLKEKDSPAIEEVGKRVPYAEEHRGSIFQAIVGNSSHCQAQLDEIHGEFDQCRQILDGFLTSEGGQPPKEGGSPAEAAPRLCQARFARIYAPAAGFQAG